MCDRIGTLYVPADFIVTETGVDESSPIIMGTPFLNTAGAVIYASAAKISFIVKRKKKTFSIKNKTSQFPEQPQYKPRKRNNRRNKQSKYKKQVWTELAKMVTAVHNDQDHQLKSPHLNKKDDPGVPTIECTINRCSF